jgi:hypothetical protein
MEMNFESESHEPENPRLFPLICPVRQFFEAIPSIVAMKTSGTDEDKILTLVIEHPLSTSIIVVVAVKVLLRIRT